MHVVSSREQAAAQLKYMSSQLAPARTQVAKPQAASWADPVVISFWSPDTVVGGLE